MTSVDSTLKNVANGNANNNVPLNASNVAAALKQAGMKGASSTPPSSSATVIASSSNDERFAGMPAPVIAVLTRNNVLISDDDQEKKTAQKNVAQQWISSGKKGSCPNVCAATFKWYAPNQAKKIVEKNGKQVERGFLSQFPNGHCRITRWNAFGQRSGREEFYDAQGRMYHSIQWAPCNRTVQQGRNKISVKWERVGNEMFYNVENGQVSHIIPWVAGPLVNKIVKSKENGKKKTIQVRRSSRIHGIEQIFSEFTNRTITWQNGKRHGAECAVHVRTGVMLCERTWINDQAEGAYITKYRSGQVAQQMQFVLGRMQGDQISYFRNGQVRSIVPFWGGKRHGTELNTVVTKQQDGSNKYETTQQHWCKGERRASPPPANLFEACTK